MAESLRQSIVSVVIVSASLILFAAISMPSATLAVSRARRSIMSTFSLGFGIPCVVGPYLLVVRIGYGTTSIAGRGGHLAEIDVRAPKTLASERGNRLPRSRLR